MSESPVPPSYEELAALVAVQSVQLAEQSKLIEAMRVELATLRRAVGRDSSNSSSPPSQDGPAAKAKARAGKRPGSEQARDASQASDAGQGGRAAETRRGQAQAGRAAGASGKGPGAGDPPGPD